MRPIDADAIPYTMLYKENWIKGTGREERGAWKSDIDKLPTIEPKWGRWIKDEFGSFCECCGSYAYRDNFGKPWESDYCPNCGARMRSE